VDNSLTSVVVQHCWCFIFWLAPFENATPQLHLPLHHHPNVTPFTLSHYCAYSPQQSALEQFVAFPPDCITQHWRPCYVPVCVMCPRKCTTRTSMLFFPLACPDLPQCCRRTTPSLAGPTDHIWSNRPAIGSGRS